MISHASIPALIFEITPYAQKAPNPSLAIISLSILGISQNGRGLDEINELSSELMLVNVDGRSSRLPEAPEAAEIGRNNRGRGILH